MPPIDFAKFALEAALVGMDVEFPLDTRRLGEGLRLLGHGPNRLQACRRRLD